MMIQQSRKCTLISSLCLALTLMTSTSAFAEHTRLYSNTLQPEMRKGSLKVERDSNGILHFSGIDSTTGQSCENSFELNPDLVDAAVKENLVNLVLVGDCSTLALMAAQAANEAEIEKANPSSPKANASEKSNSVAAGLRGLSTK